MKNIFKNLLIWLSCLVFLGANAEGKNEIKNIDSQVQYLDDERKSITHSSMFSIPGEPLIVPDEYFEKIKSEKDELDKLGFVDEPDRAPIALNAIRGMREEYNAYRNYDNQKKSSVYEIKSFDFSGYRAGKVDPKFLDSTSEGFVIANKKSIIRAYSKTKMGDIYINEMIGAEMGVIDDSGSPNFYASNISGYKTTVRYEHRKMATLLIFPTSDGVTFIEIGNSFPNKDDELKLQEFISILTSSKEGS